MLGQTHVVRALKNALDNNRLHHAYLFTGTRGVGKTTIARIFAKAVSCENGISSTPCGTCGNCQEIDEGRYLDMLEVDAASRTGVDDTRELLENVQYAPGRGRYKIYLIDEVHMFSKSSFNALLKTLEEPPEHVIFLLATTDPQKLPVTVLSRCLQFNLTRIDEHALSNYLESILDKEKIEYKKPALKMLAEAADGSVRDALSLLDQAIVFGDNKIKVDDIQTMLGSIEQKHIDNILHALAKGDTDAVLQVVEDISLYTTEYSKVLDSLAKSLHEISIFQMTSNNKANISAMADEFEPEILQLYYQIAIKSKQDLSLAPNQRTGFEMALLRMLAFTHEYNLVEKKTAKLADSKSAPVKEAASTIKTKSAANKNIISDWGDIVNELNLSGLTLELARNCVVTSYTDNEVVLKLSEAHMNLCTEKAKDKLSKAVSDWCGFAKTRLSIETSKADLLSPAQKTKDKAEKLQANAEQSINSDPHVAELVRAFDAMIDKDSIKHR